MNPWKGLAVVFVAGAAALSQAGCGGACVAQGDRIDAELIAAADLNDIGAGAQHVQFAAWAVSDVKRFDAMFQARAEDLADRAQAAALLPMGALMETGWIKPGARQVVFTDVPDDEKYTHVALVVLYPEKPDKALVELDCEEHPGYAKTDAKHTVAFTLGRKNVKPGK